MITVDNRMPFCFRYVLEVLSGQPQLLSLSNNAS